jgi:hypothetical protein
MVVPCWDLLLEVVEAVADMELVVADMEVVVVPSVDMLVVQSMGVVLEG